MSSEEENSEVGGCPTTITCGTTVSVDVTELTGSSNEDNISNAAEGMPTEDEDADLIAEDIPHDVPAIKRGLVVGLSPTITLNEGGANEQDYFFWFLRTPQTFVVTKEFKDVVSKLNSWERMTIISGPKGVGKSFALYAIATLCHRVIPCLFCSPVGEYLDDYREYVKEMYTQFGKEFHGENYDYIQMVERFVDDFIDQVPILLIEMGDVAEYKEEHQANLMKLLRMKYKGVQLLISRPSTASEQLLPHIKGHSKFDDRLTAELNLGFTIAFKPFDMKTMKAFMKAYPGRYGGGKDVCFKLTNGNPLLLSYCTSVDSESAARTRVAKVMKKYVSSFFQSLNVEQFHSWIVSNLKVSFEMLHYAYNCIDVKIERREDYESSWLAAENITYIDSVTDMHFRIAVNFPLIYHSLMTVLLEHSKKKKVKVEDQAVLEYNFECTILSKLEELELSHSSEAIEYEQLEPMKFFFEVHVEMCTEIQTLNEGCLYHLRPEHPVIDAVGYVKVDEQPWLIMIQVSLTPYMLHKSKVGDLMNEINGKEKDFDDKAKNWVDYYSHRVPVDAQPTLKCLYAYVSPNEFVGSGIMPSSIMAPSGHDSSSTSSDIYLGLVMKSTKCAKFIMDEYKTVIQ